MALTIALAQPVTFAPPDDERNIDLALGFIADAAARGAHFIGFPETFPGPWQMPASFDPTAPLAAAAREHGIWVQYGTIEPIDDAARTAYNVLALASPDGGPPVVYRRTHPRGPWIYAGGDEWDFVYVEGDELPVFPTPEATVGLAMCSEVYVPEVARSLCLKGAELLFLPAGTDKGRLRSTWRNLIWARASENLAAVVTTQNLFSREEQGMAMIAMPEQVVLESSRPGLFVADVDIDRIRSLRADFDGSPTSGAYGVKAGALTQWHRPELRDVYLSPD